LALIELYEALKGDPAIAKALKEYEIRLKQNKSVKVSTVFEKGSSALVESARQSPRLVYPQKSNNDFWELLCQQKFKSFPTYFSKKIDPNSETQRNIVQAYYCIRGCITKALDRELHVNIPSSANIDNIVPWVQDKPKPKSEKSKKGTPSKKGWDLSFIQALVEDPLKKGDFETVINTITGFLNTILQCVCLVKFICGFEEQVSLFDIINNRGEPFDMPDMIRLVLFTHVKKDDHEELNNIWTSAQLTKDDLQYVWNAFYADEKSLASNRLQFQVSNYLEKLTNSEKTPAIMEFANYCADSVKRKTDLGQPTFGDPDFYKVTFLTSNDFKKFIYPVFYALEQKVDDSFHDIKEDIYKYLCNFIVRITIVKEEESKKFANNLPRLAVGLCQIIRDNADNPANILPQIKNKILTGPLNSDIGDEKFKAKFMEFSIKKPHRFAYFVIASIENDISPSKSARALKAYAKSNSSSSNNLEHIYPQTPDKKDWPEYFDPAHKDDRDAYINSFGNLLPLNASANSEIKNVSILTKLQAYKASNLTMVNDLEKKITHDSPVNEWTFDKIKNRTDDLAKLAVKVFSLD
jgi:hypothetical protein